ncbi:VCP-like ATPase [Armadillidium vulgare]|nr:VCP-like ATPase [Armadillidium vulgare]
MLHISPLSQIVFNLLVVIAQNQICILMQLQESFKSLLLEDGGTKNSDENIEMAFVTENKPLQKSKSFVRSSTPTRETELCKLSRSKEKVNNNNNLSLTSSQISCIDPVNSDVYYWLSHDTLIEIVSPNNEMQSELFVRKNSENSFKKLSSYFYKNKQYYLLKEMLMKKLNQSEKNPLNSWSAILLLGLPGTGKTTLIKELCSELNLHLKVANMLDYSRSPDFSTYIDNCFQQTMERAPSVLFFDQFDSFGQKNSEFSSKILKNLRSLKMSEKSVIIIGATDRPDLVSSRVRQVGRFDKEIILNLPDKKERTEIIFQMLNNYMNNIQEEKIKLLGELCIGFTYADIQYAFGTASLNARISYEKAHKSYPKDEDVCLEFECLESTMKSTVPSILRDKDYAAPRVRWEDIFGYEDKKAKLKQIATDVSRGDYSKGILFYGPPGCSKTMFAKALATETQFTFFTIKCSDLLSKYVGETEKGLNKVIEKAFLSSPALVFMDEIDSLCGRRDGTGGVRKQYCA